MRTNRRPASGPPARTTGSAPGGSCCRWCAAARSRPAPRPYRTAERAPVWCAGQLDRDHLVVAGTVVLAGVVAGHHPAGQDSVQRVAQPLRAKRLEQVVTAPTSNASTARSSCAVTNTTAGGTTIEENTLASSSPSSPGIRMSRKTTSTSVLAGDRRPVTGCTGCWPDMGPGRPSRGRSRVLSMRSASLALDAVSTRADPLVLAEQVLELVERGLLVVHRENDQPPEPSVLFTISSSCPIPRLRRTSSHRSPAHRARWRISW